MSRLYACRQGARGSRRRDEPPDAELGLAGARSPFTLIAEEGVVTAGHAAAACDAREPVVPEARVGGERSVGLVERQEHARALAGEQDGVGSASEHVVGVLSGGE